MLATIRPCLFRQSLHQEEANVWRFRRNGVKTRLMIARLSGPLVRRSAGPPVRWVAGPPIRWSAGLLVCWSFWSAGPPVPWSAGPPVRCSPPLMRWSSGPVCGSGGLYTGHGKNFLSFRRLTIVLQTPTLAASDNQPALEG